MDFAITLVSSIAIKQVGWALPTVYDNDEFPANLYHIPSVL